FEVGWQNSERLLREKIKTLRVTLNNKHKQLREIVKQQNQTVITEIQNNLNTEILGELLSKLESTKNLVDTINETIEYQCENLTSNLSAVTESLRENAERLREINEVCQDNLETVKSIE
ncbi:MAG TPA: hypothetical protein IGQ44_05400, partial [Geminocystis sp. M7585_C2015_104]|nr:hypothetical protein [Geminocystis sp. M7585_C2015_104]